MDKLDFFKNRPQEFFYILFLILFIFKYETIVSSSTFSFGHLDPDPSKKITKKLNHLFQQKNVLTFKTQKKTKL